MKRRNFLGFLGGAAVAAPAMAQSAAQSLTTAGLPEGINTSLLNYAAGSSYPGNAPSGPDRAADALKALTRLGMRTQDQHAFYRREVHVGGLDADLATFKSFSLSAKISIQRDRNYERELEHKKQTLQAVLSGWLTNVQVYVSGS